MSYVEPGRRLLLRGGETWNTSSTHTIDKAGPGMLATFGDGRANITIAGNQTLFNLSSRNPRFHDWRFVDLNIDGQSGSSSKGFTAGGTVSDFLLLRTSIRDVNDGLSFSLSILDWWETHGYPGQQHHRGVAIVDSSVHHVIGGRGSYNAYLATKQLIFLGNNFDDSRQGEHILRTPYVGKGVVGHNDLGRPAVTKHVVKMHAPGFGSGIGQGHYTEFVVMSDNTFRGDDNAWTVVPGPENAHADNRLRDIIIERNHFLAGVGTGEHLVVYARDVTIRNNVFDSTGAAYRGIISIGHRGLEPPSTGVSVLNNTAYRGDSEPLRFVRIGSSVSNTRVFNNLVSAPNSSKTELLYGAGTGLAQGSNLISDSPGFAGVSRSLPKDFALGADSPAIDAGITLPDVTSDFLEARRPVDGDNSLTLEHDLGAFEFKTVQSDSGTPASNFAVEALKLFNADTDVAIRTLQNGDVIDLAADGANLNIVAITSAHVASVRFSYDHNPNYSVENSAPYALAGDASGDLKPWTPSVGTHSLTATPYSGQNATGASGEIRTVEFTVTSGATSVPPEADAGPDQFITLPLGQTSASAILNASSSVDPDGEIVAFRWVGTPDPADVSVSEVTLPVGLHIFDLEVEDNDGQVSTDQVQITVAGSITEPPVVVGSPDIMHVRTLFGEDPKTEVIVSWRTDLSHKESTVHYGTTPAYGQVASAHQPVESANGFEHHVRLTGLTPGTLYHFAAGGAGEFSASSTFRTAPGNGEAFTFAIPADIQVNWCATEAKELSRFIVDQEPDFWMHMGDFVSLGERQSHWDGFFCATRELTEKSVMMPCLGNHEVYKGSDHAEYWPSLYLNQFRLPANGSDNFENFYYSFEYGDALFVSLSWNLSECLNGKDEACTGSRKLLRDEQTAWLEGVLSSTSKRWRFVFLHDPSYHSQHPAWDGNNSDWNELFDAHGVNAVFAGHAHMFETTVPIHHDRPVASYAEGTFYYAAQNLRGSRVAPGNWFTAKTAAYDDQPLVGFVTVSDNTATVTTYNWHDGSVYDEVVLPARHPRSSD